MYCCSECFSDIAFKKIIESISSLKGNCPICKQLDIELADCNELSVHFQQLFDLYSNNPSAERSLKMTTPVFLYQHLKLFWPKLFNTEKLADSAIHKLVQSISSSAESEVRLFTEAVELTTFLDETDDQDLEVKWDQFANEIKNQNRFFLKDMVNTVQLESIYRGLGTSFPTGTTFYRARISEGLLPKEQMWKPEPHLAKAGRANPLGIPYLYLSSDLKTTLFETRVSLHETLTVGKFVLKEPLNLVSLKNIKDLGPFEALEREFELDQFIKYRPYIQKLESELSKPVRKQDFDLDYLPTQFLCEHIKSLEEFDAVEYRSAMNPNGFNLAVFNDYKLDCVETKFYSVNKLEYEWVEL